MSMTQQDVDREQSKPENANRTPIIVREERGQYVAEWDGREVRAGNPFGLDSKLSEIGAPQPRNLYLMEAPRMTTNPFAEAARAEGLRLWPGTDFGHLPARFAFLDGASWARTHLAAQEPNDAECVALLRVMYPDIPFNSPSHYPDAMARARAALSAARAARRDEEAR